MSESTSRTKEAWTKNCPACGHALVEVEHGTGKDRRCTNEGCRYRVDIPYMGYVPPIEPAAVVDVDRELEM